MTVPITDQRGICPDCGRPYRVLIDGRVGRHGSKDSAVWPPANCSGWGKLPVRLVP